MEATARQMRQLLPHHQLPWNLSSGAARTAALYISDTTGKQAHMDPHLRTVATIKGHRRLSDR